MSRSSFLLVVVSTTHKRLVPLSNIRVIFPGLLATCIPSGSREQKGKTENALAFFITDIGTPLEVAAVDDDSSRSAALETSHQSDPRLPRITHDVKGLHQFQGRRTPRKSQKDTNRTHTGSDKIEGTSYTGLHLYKPIDRFCVATAVGDPYQIP